MADPAVDLEALLKDPRVLAGGAAVLVAAGIAVAVALRSRASSRRRSEDRARAVRQARESLLAELKTFRNLAETAVQAAAPVFKEIREKTEHAAVIGHWRKQRKHSIRIRFPDFPGLKRLASAAGLDGGPLIDLDAASRKMSRQVEGYNSGGLDDSPTPIATVVEFERELQKLVILANLCLEKYR